MSDLNISFPIETTITGDAPPRRIGSGYQGKITGMDNFREFEAGPDPFGRTYHVMFKWLQTAISIRHADTVDVQFLVTDGATVIKRTVAIPLADAQAHCKAAARHMDDAWCARLAALHLTT